MGTVAQGPDYRFQLGGVTAGRYRIEAAFASKGKTYAASQVFDFRRGSSEIQLTLAPAVDIQGTFRIEGEAPAREETPAVTRAFDNRFVVQLMRPGGSIRPGNPSAQVGADGRFSISQVAPGAWQLSVAPVPPGYLKSAQFGYQEVRFTTFEGPGGTLYHFRSGVREQRHTEYHSEHADRHRGGPSRGRRVRSEARWRPAGACRGLS